MCGLAGAFSYGAHAQPVDETALVTMRDQMLSRGPDGAGLWISGNRRVGLAHRLLAIIDLSEFAAQPMVNQRTGDVIVFNGEIYNYLQLRASLGLHGAGFVSDSDTEVL